MQAIESIHVSKTYKTARDLLALKDISLQIAEGEFVCLTGPSGCGKSTLLRMICGFIKPDSGSILSYGKPIREPSPERIMVFQEGALFPWLNVRDNVEFGMKVAGLERDKRQEISTLFLDMMNLTLFADSYVKDLSTGMKQRVSIARALAMDPDMLLMDEPLSALDYDTKTSLMTELQLIWERTNKTIIYVTHDPIEAAVLGTRIVRFTKRPGEVAYDVKNTLPHPRTAQDEAVIELAGRVRDGMSQ